MRVTRPHEYPEFLGWVVNYLNFDSISPSTKRKLSELFGGEEVRREVLGDLLPIIAPEHTQDRKRSELALERLIEKINAMNFIIDWRLERVKKRGPTPVWGVIVNIHGNKWRLNKWLKFNPKSPKVILYSFIAMLLETDYLAEVKRCGCKKFFVSDDPRQKFCNDQCRNDYNNKRRLESDYFSGLRHKKRQRDLARARRLFQEGKSPEELVNEIPGLTIRILRREGWCLRSRGNLD